MKVFTIYTLLLILLSLILFIGYINPKISKVMYFADLAKQSIKYVNSDSLNFDKNEMNILIEDENSAKNINLIVTKFYNQFLSPLIKKDLIQD